MMNMNTQVGITFWSGKKEYRCLSNFWERDVVIYGIEYESGEHCFHGEKYRRLGMLCEHENRKKELLEYAKLFVKKSCFGNAIEAKKGGGKKGLMLSNEELNIWSKLCLDVQYEICMYKLDAYEDVREDLIKSIGNILIHTASRCSEKQYESRFWEGKMVERDGVNVIIGGNKLGECWMELREQMIEIVGM